MSSLNEIKSLSNALENALKDSDLQSVTTDFAETFTDSLLNEGILRDIPILGTIIGLTKATFNLNERLLLKKLIYFLSELQDISVEKRLKLILSIENSEKHKIKVGEKLLYIIDKCDDHITAKYVATLFSSFLNEKITYQDFLRGSTIIQKLFLQDLEQFIATDYKQLERNIPQWDSGLSDFENSLITVGICASYDNPFSVEDQDDYEMSDKYVVTGGDRNIHLTDIGQILKLHL